MLNLCERCKRSGTFLASAAKIVTSPRTRYVILILVTLTSLLVDVSRGFNVDIQHAVVHSGDRGSMYGFAIAQHIDQNTSWLLIGAPSAQSPQSTAFEIKNGGAVYRCKYDKNDCTRIPFDEKGNNIHWNGSKYYEIEDKSGQWLGATVQSSGTNGRIVACAPRRIYLTTDLDKREPIGGCIVSDPSTTKFTEYSPCKNMPYGYHKQGHCMAGWSAAITQDRKSMLMGAVGSWYWQGQAFTYDLENSYLRHSYTTLEGPATHDNNYLGFSSAIGEFDRDETSDYVVGIPRGNMLTGEVTLLRRDLTTIANISGDQIGSYFGYSVTATDLNDDGLDDVIVGAPFHSDYHDSEEFDKGRVHIIYQHKQTGFTSPKRDILDGIDSQSRFGFAVDSLGDVNGDGYQDIAVGAPYAGKDHRGAVYIYHGSGNGIITKASQVIQAGEVNKHLRTFGYSISSGMDMDGNGYPDMAVGAYASENAIAFRSRPVVKAAVSMDIDPEMIDLESKKECTNIDDGTSVTCLEVTTCLDYSGKGVPDTLYFSLEWELDHLEKSRRALFQEVGTPYKYSMVQQVTKNKITCVDRYAFVKNKIRNKLEPIGVVFTFKLHTSAATRKRRQIQPVLDQYIAQSMRTEAKIRNNCRNQDVCIPDLVLSVSSKNTQHVIGTNNLIELTVQVRNRGEDSYESMLYVELPEGVRYQDVRNDQASSAYVSCNRLNLNETHYVTCDLGNPLRELHQVDFTVIVGPYAVDASNGALIFEFIINSTNSENFTDTLNNKGTIRVPLAAYADIYVNGLSKPLELVYNHTSDITRLDTPTLDVVHLYEIQNNGPSTSEKTDVRILWPSHLGQGDPLLTLDSLPVITQGTGNCSLIHLVAENVTKYTDLDGYGISALLDAHARESHSEHTRVNCSHNDCTVIWCEIGVLEKDTKALVEVRSQLSTSTLVKNGYIQPLELISLLSARVVDWPYDSDVNIIRLPTKFMNVTTEVTRVDTRPEPKYIAIWIIAVSVSCGLLLLFLLIVLLWWCGFFKRKRVNETEALTKNGAPS